MKVYGAGKKLRPFMNAQRWVPTTERSGLGLTPNYYFAPVYTSESTSESHPKVHPRVLPKMGHCFHFPERQGILLVPERERGPLSERGDPERAKRSKGSPSERRGPRTSEGRATSRCLEGYLKWKQCHCCTLGDQRKFSYRHCESRRLSI